MKYWTKGKTYFQNLLNPVTPTNEKGVKNTNDGNKERDVDIDALNADIQEIEIIYAIRKAKKEKACGLDEIPVEVLGNTNCISLLTTMFNMCYKQGIFPSLWKKGIITPVPKGNMIDPRDPWGYRGITLANSSYKLFCSVLNNRLQTWVDQNNLLANEQNGFRKERSCLDQITSLVNIIDTRKKCKQSTFAAFIDFQKAYDHVNRTLLWNKLHSLGISNNCKFMTALKGLYHNVQSSVKIHGKLTEWFTITTGLKQGCILSPILFNLYINDLVNQLKCSCQGIPIAGENVCVLMYADDLVLLARNERDLQVMLDVLDSWCTKWQIQVNNSKSQIVHFRNPSVSRSSVVFTVGNVNLEYVSQYKYLGLMISEHLDMKVTADHVAKAASRALGLLIAKSKAMGGIPFNCFKKLYESIVLSVIHYGSAVWGQNQFTSINAIHNRACRYFLGVGKHTSNAAVQGDMGLPPPYIGQWVSVTRNWCRLVCMDVNRLNYKIFRWSYNFAQAKYKNWVWKTMDFYKASGLSWLSDINNTISKRMAVLNVTDVLYQKYLREWSNILHRENGKNGHGRNKLRTYRVLKNVFETETYVQTILSKAQRSALAKFRCGSAPLRLETGRYEGIPENDRMCPFCESDVENEVHCLLYCTVYDDIRDHLFQNISKTVTDFIFLDDLEKLQVILASQDKNVIKCSAKACLNILKRRRFLLYN